MKKRNNRVAVAFIKDENDHLLMGRRNDNYKFTTPGGHLNKGEDPYLGMIREVKEETGLDVTDLKLVSCTVSKFGKLIYLFDVKVDRNQIVDTSFDPDKECDEWHYIDPLTVAKELHVPIEHNAALKHWANN